MDPQFVLPPDTAYQTGLLDKQIKRMAELSRHLVLLEQRQEMDTLLTNVVREIAYLKHRLSELATTK